MKLLLATTIVFFLLGLILFLIEGGKSNRKLSELGEEAKFEEIKRYMTIKPVRFKNYDIHWVSIWLSLTMVMLSIYWILSDFPNWFVLILAPSIMFFPCRRFIKKDS